MDVWFWFWLGLAVALSVGEIFTAGFFLLPFGVGAASAAAANYFTLPLAWQWTIFIGVSVLMLFSLRRFSDHMTHEAPQKVAGNRLIGRGGIVIETLVPHSSAGMVRVDREEWRADAPGFEPLEKGTPVTVMAVEGTHLVVKPVDTAGPVADSEEA